MTTEERRCDDLKSPREELAERIAEGDTDITTVIAAVLVNEVLPALDRISDELWVGSYYLAFSIKALAEIDAIYEHLQDLVPLRKQGEIARQRLELQEQLAKSIGLYERRKQ
jgi:hypothetical protein